MFLLLAKAIEIKSRITYAEVTVVQKLNQGTNPQSGGIRLRGPFFGSFLGKQKRTYTVQNQAILRS